MGTTKKELLEDLWKKPHSFKRSLLLKRAEAGHYHDFDTELEAPKMQLVQDLRRAGFEDLAQRTIDGAYDDEFPTLEQAEELRREVGAEVYDEVMGQKRKRPSVNVKWVCQLCHNSVACGFTVTSEIVTVQREIYLSKVTVICGVCMPSGIQMIASDLSKEIDVLMRAHKGSYDPIEGLPVVGEVRIKAQWK